MNGDREKLVIVGDGETAELAYSYFKANAHFEVAGFAAEAAHRKKSKLFGLPVIDFETIENQFNPKNHYAFVAVSYTNLNRLRRRLFEQTKKKGYHLASYINPHAVIGDDVSVGENCFILENTTIQRGAEIADNVTIWSGSSVGHRSKVGSHCFLAIHVAVSGFCSVGEGSFLGVNSCIVGNIKIGEDCIIGAGAVVTKDTAVGRVYVGNPAQPLPNTTTDIYISGAKKI